MRGTTENFGLREDHPLLSYMAELEAENVKLREALKDLVGQLPLDERLADYNLELAEAALGGRKP